MWSVGEKHHRARLSDKEVELMRELREKYKLTYKVLGEKFETNKHTVASICNYRSRYH